MTSQLADSAPTILGAAIIIGAAARLILVPSDPERNDRLMLVALFSLLGGWAAGVIAKAMANIPLPKFDLFIYTLDQHLGSPSFLLGSLVASHQAAFVSLNAAYSALPVVVTLVLLGYAWRGDSLRRPVTAFVLNVLLAPLLYLLLPVAGPRYAFASFPHKPLAATLHVVRLHAPPNGFPSVHMSTAILALCFAWKWKIARWFAVFYLLLIVISTMALGEHYAIDLLAAIPYALGVLFLSNMPQTSTRRTPEQQLPLAQPAPLAIPSYDDLRNPQS